MMKMNRCEAEIDRIRLELYEETKHMTAEEHTQWSNERAQKLVAQYGFTIGTPMSKAKDGNLRKKRIAQQQSLDRQIRSSPDASLIALIQYAGKKSQRDTD